MVSRHEVEMQYKEAQRFVTPGLHAFLGNHGLSVIFVPHIFEEATGAFSGGEFYICCQGQNLS